MTKRSIYSGFLNGKLGRVLIEVYGSNPLKEFLEGGEIGDLVKIQEIGDFGHYLKKIDETPVIYSP